MSLKKSMPTLQKLLAKIPRGKITTYKEVARALETKAYRAVGQLLHRNPDGDTYPCFKVVGSDGSLGGYAEGVKEKIRRLKQEGIEVKKGKVVNFKEKFYSFKSK